MSKKERLATLRPALPEEPSSPRRASPPPRLRAPGMGWHPADVCPLLNYGVEVAGIPCPGCADQQPQQHAPPRVWLDDLGGCWHSDYYCRALDGSMVIMERPPCKVCTGTPRNEGAQSMRPPLSVWVGDYGAGWPTTDSCVLLHDSNMVFDCMPCIACTGTASQRASPPVAATPRG